jgi:hypothetical protein
MLISKWDFLSTELCLALFQVRTVYFGQVDTVHNGGQCQPVREGHWLGTLSSQRTFLWIGEFLPVFRIRIGFMRIRVQFFFI